MEKISCIYKILNTINNKVYIGSAVNFHQRKSLHLSRLRKNNHHSILLQNSFNRYGENVFEFSVLELVSDTSQLLLREQYYLDLYTCYLKQNGFNICEKAGSSLGIKQSEETKKKRADSHRGRKVSAESKLKMSEAAKFRGVSQHVIDNLIKVRPKGPFSIERREKISVASRGRTHSTDSKKKISESKKGKPATITDKVLEARKISAEKKCIFSREQVLKIRQDFYNNISKLELTKKNFCSYSTICNIISGKGTYGNYI